MLPIQKKIQLILIALGLSLFTGVIITVLLLRLPDSLNLFKKVDLFFYNLFYSSNQSAQDFLLIVDVKDIPRSQSRSEIAALIPKLQSADVACLAFDIRFVDQIGDAADSALVSSIKAFSDRIILPIDFISDASISPIQRDLLNNLALPDSICENFILHYELEGVALPIDGLLSVIKYAGHINTIHGEYYHFPPVIHYDRYCYASLPAEVAGLYFTYAASTSPKPGETPTESMDSRDFWQEFEDISLDGDDQILINFVPEIEFRPNSYSWKEAKDHLEKNPDYFRGKIVMVVNSSVSEEPKVPTPVGEYSPWAIHASVIIQLIMGNHIEASIIFYPAIFSTLLILIGLFWFLFIIPYVNKKWHKTRVLFLGGNLIFLFVIFVLINKAVIWIGTSIPLLMFNISLLVVRKLFYDIIESLEYVDFTVAVLEGQGQNYPIQLVKSPAGEEEEDVFFESFLEDKTFQMALQRLAEFDLNRNELKWLGSKLYDAVFQSGIAGALTRSLDLVYNTKQNLRINLRLDAPELANLPWELMHSESIQPGFLVLNNRISLNRYIPLAQPLESSPFRVPLRVLVVISNPSDLAHLDVETEKKIIRKSLNPLILGGDVRLRICEHTTLDKFSEELNKEPDIIHFIGHGYFDTDEQEAFLDFEYKDGTAHPVDSETIGNLLHDSSAKMVILNNCEGAASTMDNAFTGVAQNLIKCGIPVVVAMQLDMPDDAALLFSQAFYSTFITSHSVDMAVTEARRIIMTQCGLNKPDWANPVLFLRADGSKTFEFGRG